MPPWQIRLARDAREDLCQLLRQGLAERLEWGAWSALFEQLEETSPEDVERIGQAAATQQEAELDICEGLFRVNVRPWQAQRQAGRMLSRLRILECLAEGINLGRSEYRAVFAVFGHIVYVFGILHRGFGYDPTDPRTQRVLREYDRLCSLDWSS